MDNPSNTFNEEEFTKDYSEVYNTIDLKNFVGDYVAEDGMLISFQVTNDNLFTHAFGQSFRLLKEKADPFTFFSPPLMKFSFSNSTPGLVFATFPAEDDEKYTLKKYIADTSCTDRMLQTYTGTYYCSELDCKYVIMLKDHHLFVTSNKYDEALLVLIDANHLLNDLWWMNNLLITRNNLNQITGFEVNSGGVMHLKFNKLKLTKN
jgi:hypothetical protein